MKRGPTGRYEVTSIGGETIRALVLDALPPKPPLEITPARRKLLEGATVAIGRPMLTLPRDRLDRVQFRSAGLPDPAAPATVHEASRRRSEAVACSDASDPRAGTRPRELVGLAIRPERGYPQSTGSCVGVS